MVLSRMDIIKYCKTQALIDHKCFNEKNVQTCSYDLTFSGEYYYHEENHGDHVVITKLQPGEKLRIPADAICYILSAETALNHQVRMNSFQARTFVSTPTLTTQ